jgi:prepilin-type N-terminal cleavage/methylation domain-containing protein
MGRKKGFTLIELLIVVAIIAILAAIAIPNFLEAQVRAKVSRAKADMRSVTNGIESYFVDHNKYPNDVEDGWPWYLTVQLTTPISYLTSTNLNDPFREHITTTYHVYWKRYRYINYPANLYNWGGLGPNWIGWRPVVSESDCLAGMAKFGLWRLSSAGPDRTASYDDVTYFYFTNPIIYDPTNGTVSWGDIVRSQKDPDVRTVDRVNP